MGYVLMNIRGDRLATRIRYLAYILLHIIIGHMDLANSNHDHAATGDTLFGGILSIAFVTSKILKSDCAQQPIFKDSLASMPPYQALLRKSHRTVTPAYCCVADELDRERHPSRRGSVNARQNLKRLMRLHPQPIY